jgi:hypothetical protein
MPLPNTPLPALVLGHNLNYGQFRYQEDDLGCQRLTTDPTIYTPSPDGHCLGFYLFRWAPLPHFIAMLSCLSRMRSFIRFSELESLSLDMIRWLVT